ncbi:ROK family transcriptional regulator [Sphingomonas sp. TDK1]|uniref:ROK family transcriptional regulator n=1 Tax=Sphingomonas sp. TDK1 TaxID=453247 RepID=UPI000A84BCAE|nr:ROK family transcriptional regulator [Sphingomonas sp. TDK1]
MPAAPRPQLMLTEMQKRVLLHLRIAGPLPRIDLAVALDTNSATMTRVTQQLVALDLVTELQAQDHGSRGRPSVPLTIAGRGGWSVGATVQPGWLELVVVDFRGQPLLHDTQPFDDPDPRVFARTLDARLRALVSQHGFLRGRFLGLGVAVPGYALDGDLNRRAVVQRLSGWSDIPLAETFGDVLDMPIWIENDATAAALAEYYQPGIIDRYRSILVLFLGHGVGGGLVAARDLFRGDHGNAGEIGKLFPGDAPRPSGVDLIDTFRRAGVAIESLSDVAALLVPHEALIADWIERVARQLEQAVIGGAVWLDPGAVIISGALPSNILERLATRIEQLSAPRHRGYQAPVPPMLPSTLGSRAVAIGAGMAPIHAITASPR